jgi:hypothetical protein
MKRALVLVHVLVLGGVAVADGPVRERSRVELKPAGKAFKQLSIDNELGNVRIEGYDGTAIMIETHKQAPDEDTLDRLRVSLIPDPDGTVRIMTAADAAESKPVPRSAVAIDIVIRAPHNARIEAQVGAGKLEVVNMDAGGELDSASGAISVLNMAGELYTHSVSGPMSIAQAFGSVDAATVSSDVDLDSIGGRRLIASANKGRIAGRRVRSRDVELTTTSGNIQLEAEASLRGRIVVASMRGDVDVKLHRAATTSVLVRARGSKVNLGTAGVTQSPQDGWSEAKIGASPAATLVQLQSGWGPVRLELVQ